MGNYTPSAWSKGGQRRTLSETLSEAEHEHYLDCPNAHYGHRLAAIFLDCIFLFLAMSAVERIFKVGGEIIREQGASFSVLNFLAAVKFALMATLYYYSQLWAVTRFGGSPAKLILGLRIIDGRSGETLSMTRAVLREALLKPLLLAATAGIGIVIPLFRRDRLALHDVALQTHVKRIRPH